MHNVMEAKSVVLVSTTELQVQLSRLREAIPELEELQHAYAPADPRREVVELSLSSAKRAVEFLEQANV